MGKKSSDSSAIQMSTSARLISANTTSASTPTVNGNGLSTSVAASTSLSVWASS